MQVNGVILDGLGHGDVMQLVKFTPNEARLLVVDDETAAWYKRRGIALRGKEPDQVDLLVIDRETDEAFASRHQKPSGQADGVLRRWTPARRPRLTFMKTNKQTPKVEAAGTGGIVVPHAIESTNEAEHYKAISEEDLVVKEGVAKHHWRPHLPATQSMFLNCASPIPTPRKDNTINSGYSSISVGSSETMSPAESADGLRLCHLSKWPNFEGYGFALKAERLRDGRSLHTSTSAAQPIWGGLRKRDRIVEGNLFLLY
ncbi:hypothetical protein HPB51_026597 [Rhipicephalus microplus]|uniref:PDZ domain-containing protein n=1 Tax=Rhipicephalus microplus TaxID=6941 RepID=A0A9J6D376_RHIMP|nr:hypothetical protein HPB51_026597 [Rhipicephalus microplus]